MQVFHQTGLDGVQQLTRMFGNLSPHAGAGLRARGALEGGTGPRGGGNPGRQALRSPGPAGCPRSATGVAGTLLGPGEGSFWRKEVSCTDTGRMAIPPLHPRRSRRPLPSPRILSPPTARLPGKDAHISHKTPLQPPLPERRAPPEGADCWPPTPRPTPCPGQRLPLLVRALVWSRCWRPTPRPPTRHGKVCGARRLGTSASARAAARGISPWPWAWRCCSPRSACLPARQPEPKQTVLFLQKNTNK